MGDEIKLINEGQTIYGQYDVGLLNKNEYKIHGIVLTIFIPCILYEDKLYPITILNNKPEIRL